MRMIESFISGKKNEPELCEDGLFITNDMVAVIDGVTAKGKRTWNRKSSGCYAKDRLVNYLENNDCSRVPASELILKLNELLSPPDEGNLSLLPEEYPRAAIIIYNDYYKEIWSYGDCRCMIAGKTFTHEKAVDQLNAALRSFGLEYALLNGESMDSFGEHDPGRELIRKTLLMQFAFENKKVPFGYPILNGGTLELSFLKKYPVTEGTEIDAYNNS